jgi:hypothetical protein
MYVSSISETGASFRCQAGVPLQLVLYFCTRILNLLLNRCSTFALNMQRLLSTYGTHGAPNRCASFRPSHQAYNMVEQRKLVVLYVMCILPRWQTFCTPLLYQRLCLWLFPCTLSGFSCDRPTVVLSSWLTTCIG